ncbi:MAG: hypothetical protein QM754_14405 [Tepidisphaeraceae bacterium]
MALTTNITPMPKLMIEKPMNPALPTAVGASTRNADPAVPTRLSTQASMNCITVYDAICATVGAASVTSSRKGDNGGLSEE